MNRRYGLLHIGGNQPGTRPRTTLVEIEATRSTPRGKQFLARRVLENGVPRDKHAYWRDACDVLHHFSCLPTSKEVRLAKQRLSVYDAA